MDAGRCRRASPRDDRSGARLEVFFEDFGESALAIALVYWVELVDQIGARRIDSDLRQDINARLVAAGIVVPFPQRDVHVRTAIERTPGSIHDN